MGNLAIIPARGGSKRILRKNIKDFLGKPIIAYSIETALASKLFDQVIVSTDDEEIAMIARQYGANVPFLRSEDTSNDFATLADVVKEVTLRCKEIGNVYDFVCCILPTSPFISVDLLQRSLQMLTDSGADSIRPIVRFSYPIQRAFQLSGNRVKLLYEEFRHVRSQDLEVAYHDAGMFYFMKASKGLEGEYRIGFEIPEHESQDIDNEDDWKLAEIKYSYWISKLNTI